MIALSEDPEVNSENNIINNLISDQLTVDQFLGISASTASESSDAQEDYSTEVDVSHNTHLINQCLRHNIFEKDFENPVSYNAKNFINNNLEKFKFDFETALKINLASSVTSPLNLCKKRMADCEIENMDEIRTPKSRLRTISNKYILCVDDNPMDLEITQKKLEELGYSTVLARTGQEAIDLLQSKFELLNSDCSISDKLKYFDISIVLMDCIMPDMSGFDTSRAIRSMNSEISDIPIVGLTTSATEETCNKCKESGMNYCLVKPLKIEQFNEIMTL
ncbi:1639_t:CDS:2, partial [Gigaspora margarita]